MTAKPLRAASALLALCGICGIADASCTASGSQVAMNGPKGAPVDLLLELEPRPVGVSAPVQAQITTCVDDGVSIEAVYIDATMPLHRHGMNYRPEMNQTGEKAYRASGLFFHMPGLWRIEVSVRADGKTLRFVHDIEVK